jgi:hypothetical protein
VASAAVNNQTRPAGDASLRSARDGRPVTGGTRA